MNYAKGFLVFFLVFSLAFFTMACNDIQNEYYVVHVTTVEDELFFYIDPSEGKETLSANLFGEGESAFIYLYQPNEENAFSYDQFFTTIESHYIEKNVKNGLYYLLSSDEIDNEITQFFIDKETWVSPVS